jgi:N-acetyl-anhydromuramyl-L-alanine amidase AmpD
MAQYKVIVAGHEFDCDAKIVTWHESGWNSAAERCVIVPNRCPGGVKAYSEKAINTRANRFWYRPGLGHTKTPDLKAVQSIVRMFTVHHDGCPNAKTCFQVLHDERGISCHFIIDNDGTIYQTLDLGLMGFQAAGFNPHSIGVELCNRGDAKKYPNYYGGKPSRGPARTATTVSVHGHVYLAYNFNDVQVHALEELARSLRYALPNLPVEYPQSKDKPGQQAWGAIENPKAFSGYMGHFHQTLRKWDPGPFDFKKFCERVRGQPCFPVTTKKLDTPGMCQKIPDDTEQLRAETDALYKLNDMARGGFFPVGPWGEKRLWHGGVHLLTKNRAPVNSPFPGVIVAARMGPPGPTGSNNFVLIRHDMTIGADSVRFYSLYYHLDDERDKDDAPEWLQTSKTWKIERRSVVQLIEEPVQAGTMIGHVGQAGPSSARDPQIHLAIFSRDPIVSDLEVMGLPQPGKWTVVDGTTGGRFCDTEKILAMLDANNDDTIEDQEISDFFRGNSQRGSLHYYAVLFQSEWHGDPETWKTALSTAREFADVSERDLERYIDDQIAPTLWWTKDVARHARLPTDGVVFHFHPITFVKFVNEKLLETSAEGGGLGSFDESEASVTPEGVTDDREDLNGSSFFDESELVQTDDADQWPLEKLVQGFPE